MLDEPVLIDTGAFAALFNPRDQHHAASKAQFAELPLGKAYTCWPVIVEAAYLARRFPRQQHDLLDGVATGEFPLLQLDEGDIADMQSIMRSFADQQIDVADAALVHLARRERIQFVFTFDRRHFTQFRQRDGRPFHLLPPLD